MKKITVLIILLFFVGIVSEPCFALNIGTYKSESEYGLFDGFKINWKRQNKDQKFIEVREESNKQDTEKELKYYNETEYERTRYMYDGKSIL